ncbi:MAG: substrate-binding domain-containing protein [Polyangiaceae bacterium]|nr:substrate-binding domain-containing protein [Polyangiaceae bacterium]
MSERPVLGFLVDDLLSQYQVRLLMGLQRAARKHEARLVSFPAGWFSESPPARFDGSFLFKLARPPVVEGVIVEASILATEVGVDAVQRFCASLGVPVVSVSRLDGFPWVDSNASIGLRQVIEHLVFTHGHRRLCFIRGPSGNSHSREREATFREVLALHGLPVREEWILPGDFLEGSGARAIATLLDQRRVALTEIDAVVAANDLMAVGALDELTSRGIRVPQDVALVGFDDDDLARNSDPPITTVTQLVERIGTKAVQLLLRLIAGEPVESENLVDVELIVRRSCGCGEANSNGVTAPWDGVDLTRLVREQESPCKHRLAVFFDDATGADGVDAAIRLVTDTGPETPARNRNLLEQAIRGAMSQGLDPLRWHDVVQPLDAVVTAHARHPMMAPYAARLTQAKLHISEIAAQVKASEVLRSGKDASALRVLGSVLVSSRNFNALQRVLDAALPGLGVHLCCVCLFESGPNVSLRVRVAALHTSDRTRAAAPVQRTPELWGSLSGSGSSLSMSSPLLGTATEWPLQITDRDPGNLVVFPLVFAEEPLGYVVFAAPLQPKNAWLLEGIAGHLSSAIHTMRNADRLHEARETAEAANAAKGDFVAMMSHEVRTPLTAILGQLDLVLRAPLSSDVRGRLEMARNSSTALLGIVNDLLDFSKMEAGRLDLERIRFRLDEVLQQVVTATGIGAAKKGLELIVDVDPAVPELLRGDPLHLSQVLTNLASNAVKFSFQGGVALRVELVGATESPTIRFLVEDTGIGMTEAEQQRLFRPFTQGDSSTTRRWGGTGLGLTISKRLVTLFGGNLRVESHPGKGSTFSFDLPEWVPELRPRAASAKAGPNVLLVEDHPGQRRALLRTLEACGSEVTQAESIREARALLTKRAGDFGLVLVDATLPDGDACALGIDVASSHPACPVILMVAMDSDSTLLSQVGDLPNVAVVTKPVLPSFIRDLVGPGLTPAPAPVGAAGARDGGRLSDCRVLLVQDDEVSADTFVGILRGFGASVVVAVDGGQGVHEALSRPFDLVLMDLHLPVLDGFGAAQAIRMDPRYAKVPILALTASQTPDTKRRCLNAGMNDCLLTPIEPKDLRAALEGWLRRGEAGFTAGLFPTAPPPDSEPLRNRAAILDVSAGVARLGGNAESYRHLLMRFVGTHEGTSHAALDALAQGAGQDALALVHSLVSAAGNIGANRLCSIARDLEASLHRDANRVSYALATEFRQATELTMKEARARISNVRPPSAPTPVDDERCKELLAEMAELLEQHDTSALDRVVSLSLCLEKRLDPGTTRKLAELVRLYEFEKARTLLKNIESMLEGYPFTALHG